MQFQTIHSFDPRVSHLSYANDLIICTKSSCEPAKVIKDSFRNLEKKVGLRLIELKTKCYFNKHCKNKLEVLDILNVEEGGLPVKYLSVPLSSNKIIGRECVELIIKTKDRLKGWSSRLLSFVGRIKLVYTMIQAKVNF